ncbi:hypothetical protein sscle_05g041830 [Sclerotinia sclerotiorum 1980 UF-70]|uniref:Ribosomal protein S15 n=1 Tax=Sclerotinia sclerotiorum (strain ATCC 18683 / 1980 / Ss-1) TaxID=665079 RepID=A0A1D9Q4C2_SCLS1|nr:hypothetical protein sscle_05g041830 [Sclerotinia sclerotiorum 1980 UF-70]
MPPRISIISRLSAPSLCFRPAASSSTCSFSTTSAANAATFAQRRAHKDPYALAQSRQRKQSNLERQAVLKKEREASLGDPVRGVSTPFLESLDTVGGSTIKLDATMTQGLGGGVKFKNTDNVLLNHFLTPTELQGAIQQSYHLTEPRLAQNRDLADPHEEEQAKKKHEEDHANAVAALARIVSLENANSKDKTRANIVRCIDTFGRHRTDGVLRPRAPTQDAIAGVDKPEKTPRAGPDTGSSEVQIAILTAKIRVLADQLESKRGKKDKVNKRNLRLLVHRRQKLLKYLRKKERGSDRWENLITTLGLTEGTWKGEISL